MTTVIEGNVVTPEGTQFQQLKIEDGRVVERGALGLDADRSFPEGCLIFPGFGDIHVHLREGEEQKEDYHTGSAAALNGGVTFVCDMPNNPVSPVDRETLRRKMDKGEKAEIHVSFYAAMGPDTKPFGAIRYKCFLAHSVGPLFFENLEAAEKAVEAYRGCKITFHCEDPVILEASKGAATHEERRPPGAEAAAVRAVLSWVPKHQISANIAHLSTADALNEVLANPIVTFEVTPHHLFFDTENRHQFQRGALLKMNPPLRTPEHRLALLHAVKEGKVNFLATDHAPHLLSDKLSDNPSSGVPLLDTYGGFVTWLMLEENVSPQTILEMCCEGPARFLELSTRGHLDPGARADVTVLNLAAPYTVTAEELGTKCGWSPFEGVTFPGRVEAVMLNGEWVR